METNSGGSISIKLEMWKQRPHTIADRQGRVEIDKNIIKEISPS